MRENSVRTELKDRASILQGISNTRATLRTIISTARERKKVISTSSMEISKMERKRMGLLLGRMEIKSMNITVGLTRKEDSQDKVTSL